MWSRATVGAGLGSWETFYVTLMSLNLILLCFACCPPPSLCHCWTSLSNQAEPESNLPQEMLPNLSPWNKTNFLFPDIHGRKPPQGFTWGSVTHTDCKWWTWGAWEQGEVDILEGNYSKTSWEGRAHIQAVGCDIEKGGMTSRNI